MGYKREAMKGSGDNVPRQVWAAAQRIPNSIKKMQFQSRLRSSLRLKRVCIARKGIITNYSIALSWSGVSGTPVHFPISVRITARTVLPSAFLSSAIVAASASALSPSGTSVIRS